MDEHGTLVVNLHLIDFVWQRLNGHFPCFCLCMMLLWNFWICGMHVQVRTLESLRPMKMGWSLWRNIIFIVLKPEYVIFLWTWSHVLLRHCSCPSCFSFVPICMWCWNSRLARGGSSNTSCWPWAVCLICYLSKTMLQFCHLVLYETEFGIKLPFFGWCWS